MKVLVVYKPRKKTKITIALLVGTNRDNGPFYIGINEDNKVTPPPPKILQRDSRNKNIKCATEMNNIR